MRKWPTSRRIVAIPLDEESCLVLTKAHPPVRARKLDAPAPEVIDLSHPRQRVMAASLAAVFVLGLLGWAWVLHTPTTGPSLSGPPMRATEVPTAAVSGATSERRRIPIRVEYCNPPASLRFQPPPAVTGEFTAKDPLAFNREVVLRLDLSHMKPGLNYILLMPAQLRLPPGLTMTDPLLSPPMLVLRAEPCAPQISCTAVTPPSFQVYIHGATRQELDGPPCRGPVEPYADVLGEAREVWTAVAEYLVPRPCEGGLRCNASPTLAVGVAGGSPSAES